MGDKNNGILCPLDRIFLSVCSVDTAFCTATGRRQKKNVLRAFVHLLYCTVLCCTMIHRTVLLPVAPCGCLLVTAAQLHASSVTSS